MRRVTSTVLTVFVFVLLAAGGATAQQSGQSDDSAQSQSGSQSQSEDEEPRGRPRLAVYPVENSYRAHQTSVGNALADLFISELQKTGRFWVLERSELDSLIGEIELGQQGYTEEETRVRKGNLKGVSYAFFAELTEFGTEQNSVGGGGIVGDALGGAEVTKKEARARLDFRLVEAEPGKTLLSGTGNGTISDTDFSVAGGNFGNWLAGVDVNSSEFRQSALGKATLKAVNQIIDQIKQDFPLRASVVAVSGETVFLDLGSSADLAPGVEGKLYQIETIRDDDGTVVFEEKKRVADVEITEVQATGAKGECSRLAPFTDPKEGMVVEFETDDEGNLVKPDGDDDEAD